MDRKKILDQLIANKRFDEADREVLMKLSDKAFENVTNENDDEPDFSDLTPEEWVENAPDHIKGKIGVLNADPNPKPPKVTQNADADSVSVPKAEWAKVQKLVKNQDAQEDAEKAELIPIILNAKGNRCTEATLKGFDLRTLRAIASPIIANQQASLDGDDGPDELDQPIFNNYGGMPGVYNPKRVKNAVKDAEEEGAMVSPTFDTVDKKPAK
jgi:hypothetical protein